MSARRVESRSVGRHYDSDAGMFDIADNRCDAILTAGAKYQAWSFRRRVALRNPDRIESILQNCKPEKCRMYDISYEY